MNIKYSDIQNISFKQHEEYFDQNLFANNKMWFFDSGKLGEHYQLLAYMSTLYNNSIILDIGTNAGCSALALSYNKTNYVHSLDIENKVHPKIIDLFSNVRFYTQRIQQFDINLLNKASLILYDTAHDGISEITDYDYIMKSTFKGVILFDDILLNNEMKTFWASIKEPKENITKFGHFSGTGIVYKDTDVRYNFIYE